MKREWKSGDVAYVPLVDGTADIAIRRHDGTWRLAGAPTWSNGHPVNPVVREIRPLLVLDPNSLDDMDTICKALVEAMHRDGYRLNAAKGVHPLVMQTAVRSLLEPPKPPEPQGLGAVVRDDGGYHWLRWSRGEGAVWRSPDTEKFICCTWSRINVVEVLSEGVQP